VNSRKSVHQTTLGECICHPVEKRGPAKAGTTSLTTKSLFSTLYKSERNSNFERKRIAVPDFKKSILEGIPEALPEPKRYDPDVNHAPKRKDILNSDEKKLAIRNALRYFHPRHHPVLAREFMDELLTYGRIYMFRLKPEYKIHARSIAEFPHQSTQAAAIMLMISNNLDPIVAQHPDELITYGGNGAVFQNWAQYRLTMKYLAEMSDEQTLVLYSGHPMGLFPSHKEAPRVVVTNGMVVPNYSSPDDWERMNALGVSQYGQMTAGSFMYIGPQGIVHGTTITLLNAGRIKAKSPATDLRGKIFVTSGLGGMSGAQPKATVIAGGICLIAEVNPKAIHTRHNQGWVNEVFSDLDKLLVRMNRAKVSKEAVSLAYQGNVVDLWEELAKRDVEIDLGSDQTSLHNPWAGGYYPAGISFERSNELITSNPDQFKALVQESLRRQVTAINKISAGGMYFWDYGNAFLLESGRAGADIFSQPGTFRYPSYVQDIMGPLFFDFGFGPFRWVCCSNDPEDLAKTDLIAADVLEGLMKESPEEIISQMADNLKWIRQAGENKMVVGSQARILYADANGRIRIAEAFNKAIASGYISAPIVLGRDHHDVSGTDSPFRETSNIYDGSAFTADMAVQNAIGDSFRGATWISLHNGGGVGWGEVINGGFGLVLDGTEDAGRRLKLMLHWDVNNGIARRSWARNPAAMSTIERTTKSNPSLVITMPNLVDDRILDNLETQ
jgi:urocanate hydratase